MAGSAILVIVYWKEDIYRDKNLRKPRNLCPSKISSYTVCIIHWLSVDSSGAEKKLAEIEKAKNKKVTTYNIPQPLFDTMPLCT